MSSLNRYDRNDRDESYIDKLTVSKLRVDNDNCYEDTAYSDDATAIFLLMLSQNLPQLSLHEVLLYG